MKTIPLSEVQRDMPRHFGPPPKIGWLVARANGKCFMYCGRSPNVERTFYMNAQAQNAEILRIVKG